MPKIIGSKQTIELKLLASVFVTKILSILSQPITLFVTRRMKRIIPVILLLVLVSSTVFAQQDPQFTQFFHNQIFNNPGYAGMDPGFRAHMLHRTQWLGNSSNVGDGSLTPQTQVIAFNAPINRLRSGAAIHAIRDQIGAEVNFSAMGSYAYHLPLGKGKLSLGVRGGIFSKSLDYDLFRAINPNDPVLRTGSETQAGADLGFGAWYKAEKYFVGIAASHLLPTQFDFGTEVENALSRHFYVNAGYNFEAGYVWTITPQVLLKYDENVFQPEGAVIANYQNKFFGGMTYRYEDAVAAVVGLGLMKDQSLRFSYSMDLTAFNQEVKSLTSHEVMLSYNLPVVLRGSKPVIRTPRYRK